MRKFLALILISTSLLFGFNVNNSLAANLKDAFTPKSGLNTIATESGYNTSDSQLSLEYYVGLALNMIFSVIGIVLIGLFLYSGIMWMTARGNEGRVKKAKDNIIEAIIGLLLVIGGYALSIFLLNIFF